jgi:hypothetical protein
VELHFETRLCAGPCAEGHSATYSVLSERLGLVGRVERKKANRYTVVCSLPKFLELPASTTQPLCRRLTCRRVPSPANEEDTAAFPPNTSKSAEFELLWWGGKA